MKKAIKVTVSAIAIALFVQELSAQVINDVETNFPIEGSSQLNESLWPTFLLEGTGSNRTIRIGVTNDTYIFGELEIENNNNHWGRIHFKTANQTGGTQTRMSIQGDGKIGIGTTSPNAQLSIQNNLSFGGTLSPIPSHLTSYNQTSNPQIPSLISGSTGGTLMEASSYGHFVIGIRDNGGDDGLHVISTGQTYTGQANGQAAPYNKLVASFLANGKVGIGLNNPQRILHIGNESSLSAFARLDGTFGYTNYENHSRLEFNDKNFGIGAGKISTSENGTDDDLYLYSHNGPGRDIRFMSTSNGETDPSTWNQNMIIKGNNGYVGIGTTSPDAKLTVKGDIHTQEVKVDLNGSVAPDFVFMEGYHLRTLEETASYIKTNKHLPEIPSASQMEEDGFELKKMNLKLLQKVEELTLYLIEQNEEIKKQQIEIDKLKSEITTIKTGKN